MSKNFFRPELLANRCDSAFGAFETRSYSPCMRQKCQQAAHVRRRQITRWQMKRTVEIEGIHFCWNQREKWQTYQQPF